MATFNWCPAFGATENTKPLVLKAQFGDGYQQRVADGINTLKRNWTLSFSKKQDKIEPIRDFLRARAGVESFDWTPPRGAAGKWVCEEWNLTVNDGGDSVSLTFLEVFE
jgi:phage-related protein